MDIHALFAWDPVALFTFLTDFSIVHTYTRYTTMNIVLFDICRCGDMLPSGIVCVWKSLILVLVVEASLRRGRS